MFQFCSFLCCVKCAKEAEIVTVAILITENAELYVNMNMRAVWYNVS